MSIAFALFLALSALALACWFVGVLLQRMRGGWTAVASAGVLLCPGLLLFLNAPVHLLGIDGEEIYGFTMLAAITTLLAFVALPIALIIRSRLHPFGINKGK